MSDHKPLIQVDRVSKKYCRSQKISMRYGMADITRDIFGLRSSSETLRESEYWALDKVSLSVMPGECIGIIGPNGSGKSTLLKLVSGIYPPDSGSIRVRGRISTLIEVGAGFHPMLTGRENIYVNSAILGLDKREIDRKLEEIISFSELEEFIDSPVRHYSSGMYTRLGFSVAAHTKPDIFLIDEALAVGDTAFRLKCLNRIAELRDEGTAILFVSHSEMQVREAANRCLLLDHGKCIAIDKPGEAFRKYQDVMENNIQTRTQSDRADVHGDIRILGVEISSLSGTSELMNNSPIKFNIRIKASKSISNAYLVLRIWSPRGQLAGVIDSRDEDTLFQFDPGETVVPVTLDSVPLVPGNYRVGGGFRVDASIIAWSTHLGYLDLLPGERPGNLEGIAAITANYKP